MFVMLWINELKITQNNKDNIDDALVSIVYLIMGGNMVFCVIITAKNLIKFIAISMRRTIVPINSPNSVRKLADNVNTRPWADTSTHNY